MKIHNCSSCGSLASKIATERHLVEDIEMDLYLCESCGKVEFYKSNFKEPQVNFIYCDSCGNEVDDREIACPYCDEILKK